MSGRKYLGSNATVPPNPVRSPRLAGAAAGAGPGPHPAPGTSMAYAAGYRGAVRGRACGRMEERPYRAKDPPRQWPAEMGAGPPRAACAGPRAGVWAVISLVSERAGGL